MKSLQMTEGFRLCAGCANFAKPYPFEFMTCPICQTSYIEAQCPVCAPFKRLLALSRQKRKNYAQIKADERIEQEEKQQTRKPYNDL